MKFVKKITFLLFSLIFLIGLSGCEMFMDETKEDNSLFKSLSYFKLSDSKASISVGELKMISFSYMPISLILTNFTYDKSVIEVTESSLTGMVIRGIAEGQTSLTVSANGLSATCIVTVSGFASGYELDTTISPYIYSGTNIMQLSPGRSEKIYVSLYGGSVSDINNYSWSIENPAVASINSTGQYCYIQGLSEGYTRISVTNPAAAYPFYIGVYVFSDPTLSCYITSGDNIKTLYVSKGEESITVDLVNPKTEHYKDKFTYSLIDGDSDCLSYVSNKNQVIFTPKKEGQVTLRVMNSEADNNYPLDILVRVVELVDGTYIIPSDTTLTVTGDEIKNVSCEIFGLTAERDYSTSDFEWTLEPTDALEIYPLSENCQIKGLKNGSASIYVRHPCTQRRRQILVIVNGQKENSSTSGSGSSAVYDSKIYLSTDQNYIKTKIGAEDTILDILLWGGEDSDYKNFAWSVKETPREDNTGKTVIDVTPEHSENSVKYTTRGIAYSSAAEGKLHITPVATGTATITVTHPKAYYPLEITVKVLGENESLDEENEANYLSCSKNVINIPVINSSVTASIQAHGTIPYDTNLSENMNWEIEDESIATVTGNGENAIITSVSEGETIITVSHPDSENKIKLYVRVGSRYIDSSESVKYITTSTDLIAITKDSSTFTLTAILVNGTETEQLSGYNFSIDDESVAKISAQYTNGKCYIVPVKAGQCELSVTHPATNITKHVLIVVGNTVEELQGFKYLTTGNNVVTVGEGSSKAINVSVANSSEIILDGYTWTSKNPEIAGISATSTGTATIIGNSIGQTIITVKSDYCKYPLDIIVQVVDPVSASACPYIKATASVLTLSKSNAWTSVTASLEGGSDEDISSFEWYSDDTTILEAYGQNGVGKIRAVNEGITYLRIRHPKAVYDQLVMCICDSGETSEYSISTSCGNILSLQPSKESQTITANLVNGSATDIYNFTWSLDVYDIVDLTYSANTAVITPLKEGVAQLTIHHPKSTYDQTVVIKVQQYSSFGFGSKKTALNVDDTTFVNMEVPAANVSTTVVYTIDNPTVASVQGTNSILAIKGLSAGTAIVHAKMMSGTTVYAETQTDLLVTVNPKSSSTKYISSSSTIYTMNVGDSKIFTANLIGTKFPLTDIYNLQWKVGNPSILEMKGGVKNIDGDYVVTGNQLYCTALSAGETTITITHEEVETPLVYHVIVSGTEEMEISLSKSYIVLDKGSKTEIKATITNGTTDDYKTIEWSADKVNNANIVSILGSGQTIAVYAIKAGSTTLTATLPNGSREKCTVLVNETKSLTLDSSVWRVRPNETKNFYYTVSPSDSKVSPYVHSTDGKEYFTISSSGISSDSETGRGYFTLTGIMETTVNQSVTLTTAEGVYTNVQVVVSWQNSLSLNKTSLRGSPDEVYRIEYKVSPPNTIFEFANYEEFLDVPNEVVVSKDDDYREGYFVFTPNALTKSTETFTLYAVNESTRKTFDTRTITANFSYDSYEMEIKNFAKSGYFSKYDGESSFEIGDGEYVTFDLESVQKLAEIKSITYSQPEGFTVSHSDTQIKIKNKTKDMVKPCYKITKLRYPSGASWTSSGWYWKSSYTGIYPHHTLYCNLYLDEVLYGTTTKNPLVDEKYTNTNRVKESFTVISPMYYLQDEIKKYPYLYHPCRENLHHYDLTLVSVDHILEEGAIAANSNASLTDSSEQSYVMPPEKYSSSSVSTGSKESIVLVIKFKNDTQTKITIVATPKTRYCAATENTELFNKETMEMN